MCGLDLFFAIFSPVRSGVVPYSVRWRVPLGPLRGSSSGDVGVAAEAHQTVKYFFIVLSILAIPLVGLALVCLYVEKKRRDNKRTKCCPEPASRTDAWSLGT